MKTLYISLIIISIAISNGFASDYELVKNLNGTWKFSIGDDLNWAQPNFDDSNWDEIYAPNAWENQGYHGYDGYAWYRKTIELQSENVMHDLYLDLGYIDDVDEVFINGEIIGNSGNFYPSIVSAYNARRFYTIPQGLVPDDGRIVIAIRVLDIQLEGGIVRGDLSLLQNTFPINFDVALSGMWNFKSGDSMAWKNLKSFNDEWDVIQAPGFWENQGYKNYDGYGWYTITVELTPDLVKEKLVLILGKIDDYDQTFVNGVLVGSTGFSEKTITRNSNGNEYKSQRNYIVEPGVFKTGKNIIAIRVFDKTGEGGIYSNPIGIVTHSRFIAYWKNKAQHSR